MMMIPALFLLDGLSPEEVETCLRSPDIREWECGRGETLYDPKHAPRSLAYLLEGHALVMQGRAVMKDLYAGDVFGVAALFGSSEPYPSTVVAVTDCRLLLIPQEVVSQWMARVPRVGENYVRFLSDRIRFLNRRLGTLTAGAADGKLWHYLLDHRDEQGVVSLPGGMQALAKRLDMGRSSLYRSLDALIAAGHIRREGKSIIVL